MASTKVLAVLGLVVIALVDARCNKTCRQERRERFLQKFLDGNGTDYSAFSHFQQRLAKRRERLSKRNHTATPDEQAAAKRFQELHKNDTDAGFEDISTINEAVRDLMYQDDMLLTEDQANNLLSDDDGDNNRTKRQAQIGNGFPRNQWTVGQPIPFTFTSSISTATRALIRLAVQFWTDNTCLSFAENGSGANSLYFNQGSGCYSYVGRVFSQSQQEVSIGQGCELFGIITHEIGHALGFFHTMSRYDRDSYVSIQTQNVPANYLDQFDKETTATNNNYNVEYDYGSVMHYAESTGAVGSPVQMLALQNKYQRTMGNRIQPAFDDILLMNRYYGCINMCSTGITCQNGGFRNSKNCNTCICPSGFGGADCSQRAGPENGATNCGATLTATSTLQTLTGQVGQSSNTQLSRAMGCHWHIQAPAGQYVQLTVTSISGACSQGCAYGGMEIKHQSFTRTGTRLCCSSDPSSTGTLTSATNLAVVSAYSYYNVQKFTIQYRAVTTGGVPAPGPSPPAPAPGPSPSSGTCTDNASCTSWVANGFCTNTFYTAAQKQQYCPSSCGLCISSPPAPTSTCTDVAQCTTYIANGFCSSTFYTTAQKQQYCPNACGLCQG